MTQADQPHRAWLEPVGGWLNLAHRGARSLAPENTLAAARAALTAKAHGWELDVARTADGELVVVHDHTLERTSDVGACFPQRSPWRVEDFTLAEIAGLDFGSWFVDSDPFGQIAGGAVSAKDLAGFKGLQAPTLAQALEFTRANHWLVNVEIKDLGGGGDDEEDFAAAVVDLIVGMDMTPQVLVSSFNHDYLRLVRARSPELAIGVLVNYEPADPLGLVRMLGAQTYHPCWDLIARPEVETLRANGIGVMCWTVNDEYRARELLGWGVSGLFSDFPQRMAGLMA